jgi:hypothetical protein
MHVCVEVDDIDAAESRVLAVGAHRLDGDGDNWRVYADPAGHPFCLTRQADHRRERPSAWMVKEA